MGRIENITGIPETNSENLQLLRYEESQFYQTHNDVSRVESLVHHLIWFSFSNV